MTLAQFVLYLVILVPLGMLIAVFAGGLSIVFMKTEWNELTGGCGVGTLDHFRWTKKLFRHSLIITCLFVVLLAGTQQKSNPIDLFTSWTLIKGWLLILAITTGLNVHLIDEMLRGQRTQA